MIFDALTGTERDRPRNQLLAALPDEEWRRVRGLLEPVRLKYRQVLFDVHRTIEHVFFPEEGVISILGLLDDGSAIETATIGCEGMAGVPVYLGAMEVAGQALVQVAGSAYRMAAEALRAEVRDRTPLADLLGRYTQALFTLVAQSSACNRKHSVEQRCARWLLMVHDRMRGDEFDLTQLFLSQMLGVRRASVSEVMRTLQGQGLVRYARGHVTVQDRSGLEAAACVCYRIIRNEFARMLAGATAPGPLDARAFSENGLSTAGDGAPQPADRATNRQGPQPRRS